MPQLRRLESREARRSGAYQPRVSRQARVAIWRVADRSSEKPRLKEGAFNMRSLIAVPQFLAVSAYVLVAGSVLQAQAPQAGTPAAGRAGQMQLSSPTPLAETENLEAYPAAPEGFNVARE